MRPRRIWYRKYWQWSSVSGCGEAMIWCKSVSISSVTKYTSSKRLRERGRRMSCSQGLHVRALLCGVGFGAPP